MTMPEAVVRSASTRLTITRSCKGRIFIKLTPSQWKFTEIEMGRADPGRRGLLALITGEC